MAKRKKQVKAPVKPVPEVETELSQCHGEYYDASEGIGAYSDYLRDYGYSLGWSSDDCFMGIEGRCVFEVFNEHDRVAYHLNIFYCEVDKGFDIYASLSRISDE